MSGIEVLLITHFTIAALCFVTSLIVTAKEENEITLGSLLFAIFASIVPVLNIVLFLDCSEKLLNVNVIENWISKIFNITLWKRK